MKSRELGIHELIDHFSSDEWARLGRFVLYQHGVRKGQLLNAELERLRDPVQRNQTPNPQKSYRLHAQLRKSIHDFLVAESLDDKALLKYPLLVDELVYRGLKLETGRVLRRYQRDLDKLSAHTADYFQLKALYEYQTLQYEHRSYRHRSLDLNEIHEARDCQYLLEKLRLLCLSLSMSQLYKVDTDIPYLEEIQRRLAENPQLLELRTVKLYSALLESLLHPRAEIAHIDTVTTEFLEDFEEYSLAEAFEIFSLLLNYFLGQSRQGKGRSQLFQLYSLGLSKGLLLVRQRQELPVPHFKNLVSCMLHAQGPNYVRQELPQMLPLLHVDFRNCCQQYAKALLFHWEGHFQQARQALPDHCPDLYLELSRRVLGIMILADLGDDVEWLLSELHKSKMWLIRHPSLPERVVSQYQHQFKLVGWLAKGHYDKLLDASPELMEMDRTMMMEWLCIKIQALRKLEAS